MDIELGNSFKLYVLITLLRDLRMHLYCSAATTPHGLVSGKIRSWDGPIFIGPRSDLVDWPTQLIFTWIFISCSMRSKRTQQGNLLGLIIVFLCQQLTHFLAYWLTTLLKLERFDLLRYLIKRWCICRKICKNRIMQCMYVKWKCWKICCPRRKIATNQYWFPIFENIEFAIFWTRVTLIVWLPPRLTSFSILSSQIFSQNFSNFLHFPQISSQILHFLPARLADWNN